MKKLILITLIALLGCSKKEDALPIPITSIVLTATASYTFDNQGKVNIESSMKPFTNGLFITGIIRYDWYIGDAYVSTQKSTIDFRSTGSFWTATSVGYSYNTAAYSLRNVKIDTAYITSQPLGKYSLKY